MKDTATSTVTAFPYVKKTELQANVFNRAFLYLSGLAMIISPLAQMTAFAIHPQFWTFKKETDAAIQYVYTQTWGWQTGHALVYVTLPLMLLYYVQLARLVSKTRPWLALVGIAATWYGVSFIIGNFGSVQAEGAIGNLLPKEVAIPAIQLFVDNARLMAITFYGQMAGVIGPMIILAGLALSPKAAPRWSGPLALIGNLIVVAFIDIDAFMFVGQLAVLIGLLPVALKLLKGQDPAAELS
jgi:hypothetical protein